MNAQRVPCAPVVLGLALCVVVAAEAGPDPGTLRAKHPLRTEQLGMTRPEGLAYVAETRCYLVFGRDAQGTMAIARMTEAREPSGSTTPATGTFDPAATAYDPTHRRLVTLDVAARTLTLIPVGADGAPDVAAAQRSAAPALGLMRPAGAAVDPADGTFYVLDRLSHRIAHFVPGAAAARWIAPPPVPGQPRALAFDAARRHLFTLDRTGPTLRELTLDGAEVGRWPVGALGVRDPLGMTIAPTRDQTDDPAATSVYVADGGPPGAGRGRLVELAWRAPVPATSAAAPFAAEATLPLKLIRRTATSSWSPPSPDPDGIAWDPHRGRLIISDSEVEETSRFAGRNVFEASLSGSLRRSFNVTSFTKEPVGVAYRPSNHHLFLSDDDRRRVFEIDPGADDLPGTSDDKVTSFSTSAFGATDPEGIAYDPGTNRIYLCDGVNEEIYVVRPGANGLFDGVDDTVTHFDIGALGVDDPETVELRGDTGTLLTVGHTNRTLTEFTTGGALVSRTSLSFTTLDHPSGLAWAPSSGDATLRSLYIVCRGVDNDADPNENDGVLVEIQVASAPPPPPGTVDVRVAASTDDAEEQATGGVNLTSPDLELVHDGTDQTVGMRFRVPVAPGAHITRAWIQFEAFATGTQTTSLTIRGQAGDNPSAFTSTSGSISSRPRTSASAGWSPPAWSAVGDAGTAQRTPDLAAIVQEIVNRSGWSSGNAMVMIVTGTGKRTAASFDGKASGAPVLHVEFSTSAASAAATGD